MTHRAVCLFRPVTLPAGSPLYLASFPAHSVFAVRSGTCKSLRTTRTGREQVLKVYRPGDFIGLDSLSLDMYANTTQASTKVVVCHAPRKVFTELVVSEPPFAHEVIRYLCDELQSTREDLASLGTLGALARVSRLLSQELREQGGAIVHLPLNRKDTATLLGMAEESLSRQLTQLEELGVLRRKGRRLLVTDRQRLDELAAQ